MTLSTTINKVSYSGTGSQDTFAYTYKIFSSSDIEVYIRNTLGTETKKTITTHYTVSNVGNASGGNIVFTTGNTPLNTDTVIIVRTVPLTQTFDYVLNDPFPSDSHEDGLDKLTMQVQQVKEEVDRSIKASVTNTIASTEFTQSSTDRANKLFGFDSSGNLSISTTLGTNRGNWAASTVYSERDIVKDTSTNNIFQINSGHTSSGSQPLTTNANSAKYTLLVDAATATTAAATATTKAAEASTSATASATSATASAASATSAAASLDSFTDIYLGEKSSAPTVDNDGDALANGALYWNTSSNLMYAWNGSAWLALADAASVASSASSATTSKNAAASSATASANSAATASGHKDTATTKAAEASSSQTAAASAASTASGHKDTATTKAAEASSSQTAAANSATASATSATASAASATSADTSFDNFNARYLGAKGSAPSSDNDGNTLIAGALYFNSSSNELFVRSSSNTWVQSSFSAAGFMSKASNLGDVTSASTSRNNLGLGTAATLTAGTSASNAVQLDGNSKLPAVDGSALTNLPAGGTVNRVADGAIAIRKPVVLTSAGKAKQVAEATVLASGASAVYSTMDNSDTGDSNVSTVYEPNSGAFAIVYKDTSNSSYGTCVCGTWSDGTITWGTPVVFETSAINNQPHITAGGNRIHVSYRASDTLGGIRSASISGTTPTFAAETVWGKATETLGTTELSTTHAIPTGGTIHTVYDTTSARFVTVYNDSGNSNYGTAVVHYISNTGTGATTYGTPVVFESGSIDDNGKGARISADTNTSRVVVAFRDSGDSSKGKAIVGSVTAGTNAISFGTAATFNNAHTQYPVIVEDPNTNKQAIFYRNYGGDSGHGYGIVGTVTGGTDNTIAFGTAVEFNGTDTQEIAAAYSPDTNKILVVYTNVPGGQMTGKSHVATISGTNISFGDQDQWQAQRPTKTSMAYDETANKFLIAYNNQDDNGYGYVIVGTMSGTDMTYGSATVKFEAEAIDDLEVGYNPSYGKCYVIQYNGTGDDVKMETITISGTTPSTAETFQVQSAEPNSSFMGTAYDPINSLVVVTYCLASDSDLKTSVVKTADGIQADGYHIGYDTSTNNIVILYSDAKTGVTKVKAISHNTSNGTYTAVGSSTVLNLSTTHTTQSDVVFDPDTNRTIVAYKDNTNNQATANVVQTGGTAASPTVTVGSNVLLDSGDTGGTVSLSYDTTNNKVFVAYENATDGAVKGAIGTITAGTNAASFAGHANIWNPSSGSIVIFAQTFDDDKDKVMFFYRDTENGDDLTYKIITSGASSFSVATGAELSANDTRFGPGSASFGTGKGVLVGIKDEGNSNKISYATTRFAASTTTTLDNANYLGVAAEAISDTATGKINVIGGISEGHSSLTIGTNYFATDAGAIATSGTQLIGKALSATEIQLGVKSGTAAHNTVALDANAKLPAVDGSQLTNLPSPSNARIFCGSYDFRVDGSSTAQNVLISLPSGYTVANVRSYEINVHGVGFASDGNFLCMLPYNGSSSVYSGPTYNTFTYMNSNSGTATNNSKTQSAAFMLNWANGTSYDLYSANDVDNPKQNYNNASGHGGQLTCRAVYTNSLRNGSLMYDASWRYGSGNHDQAKVLSIASASTGATTSNYADGFYFYIGNASQAAQSVAIMEGVVSVYAIIG